MGTPLPGQDPPPSPFTVLGDFVKGIITLSSAILALTAAFSANLLGKPTSADHVVILIAAWCLLAVSVLLAIVSHGSLVGYLMHGRDPLRRKAIWQANAAHWAMLSGMVIFGVFAGLSLIVQAPAINDGRAAAQKTIEELAEVYKTSASTLQLRSTEWSDRTKFYTVVVDDSTHQRTLTANFDPAAGHVLDTKATDIPKPVVVTPAPQRATWHDAYEVQKALARLGYNVGPVDGIVGGRTRTALRRFQAAHGLPALGQLDQQTLDALSGLALGAGSP